MARHILAKKIVNGKEIYRNFPVNSWNAMKPGQRGLNGWVEVKNPPEKTEGAVFPEQLTAKKEVKAEPIVKDEQRPDEKPEESQTDGSDRAEQVAKNLIPFPTKEELESDWKQMECLKLLKLLGKPTKPKKKPELIADILSLKK